MKMEQRMKTMLALAAVTAVLLVGCASAPAAPPKDGGTFSSLADLKNAYVQTGEDCATLTPMNVKRAAQSGRCSPDVVLETFVSNADVDATVQEWKTVFSRPGSLKQTPMLVGQNWIIQAPRAAQLQGKMGGQLVEFLGS